MNVLHLLILSLATWRLASLFASEHGPYYVFDTLRYYLGVRLDEFGKPYGTNELSRGILCIWCSSIWFGTAITLFHEINSTLSVITCTPLALSAVAILLSEGVRNGHQD